MRRLGVLCGLVMAALLLARGVVVVDGVQLLRSLAPFYDQAQPPPISRAWDTGWQRLCVQHAPPAVRVPATSPLGGRALTAALATGDFPGAQALVQAGLGDSRTDAAIKALLVGNWIDAVSVADTPTGLTDAMWGSVLYLAAQTAAAEHDFARADALLARAEPLYGEEGPLPSSALGTCLAAWGRGDEARAAQLRASVLLPSNAAAVDALADQFLPSATMPGSVSEWVPALDAHPQYALPPAPAPAAWTTVGVDVDEDDLDHSPALRVKTYWTAEQRPGEVLVHRDVVRDLVANGGFAWDYVSDGRRPVGFSGSIYHNPTPLTFIPDGRGNRAVCLHRPAVDESVGLEGTAFPLPSGGAVTLVQAGDVMSPSGAGFGLAHRWEGSVDEHPYRFVSMAPAAPTAWTRYAAVDTLPVGATTVRAWLMNTFGPAGAEVCFAHLFMFQLSPPQ